MVLAKYILVAAQKDKAIELQDKIDTFAERFRTDVLLDIFVGQGLVSVPIYSLSKLSDSWYQMP